MGFLDNAKNKAKSTFNTTSSKYDESKQVRALESQIKDERNKVRELYETIGKEYYRYTVDGDESHKNNFDSMIADINKSRELIEELEGQIEDVRAKAKEDRENIKAEADARAREIQEADEQARAEKKAAEKEKDDLF
jgi:hypothetical protein